MFYPIVSNQLLYKDAPIDEIVVMTVRLKEKHLTGQVAVVIVQVCYLR